MKAKSIFGMVAGLVLALSGASLTPIVASAAVPAGCSVTITKGGSPASESDVEITLSGIYCVAKFKTVGSDYSFTVPAGITKLDYLVVAGGGGGGSGGGGGGGVLQQNDYSVASGSAISVTVGRGGTGGSGGRGTVIAATKGADSKFGAITANGGGAGGTENVNGNVSGGSGGGSRFDCTVSTCGSGPAGSGVTGQGNNGGYSTYNSYGAGGGGGGAGGAGFNTTRTYIGGNGGIGIASDITGSSTYYGGGGGGGINNNHGQYVGVDADGNLVFNGQTPLTTGGGQGGLGGGGYGSSYGAGGASGKANAADGAPNTGGGGGGTDPEDIDAGDGGSGVVIARWVSNTNLKTITFNSNTANATTVTQNVAAGVSTPLNANTFARTGYVFSGWTVLANGNGTVYDDQTSFTTSQDMTLYAKWLAGVTHTVTFNNNGGTGTMENQVSGTSTNLSPNTMTRSGYTFAGWNTNANGTGFAYDNQAIYSFADDVTLYAQWEPIVATYKVTFYGNAATGGSTASQTASSSTALNLNGFTRTGYNFLGWNENYGASTATFKDGQKYSFATDKNLYAIWVAQANNDIVFNGNSASSGSMSNQTASNSTRLSANNFVKDNHTFLNWNTLANGTGVSYQSNYVYSFAEGITLYAQWGENISIAFSANGATSGIAPATQNTYVGSPGINLPLNSGTLVKRGYRLAGWNTADDGTGTPYALGASSVKFATARTLYAHWTPATYSVIYSGNGASAGSEPAAQTFTYGSSVSVRDNIGGLTKDGYTFAGWNTADDGSGVTYTPAQTNVALSTDTVLFAQWTRIASVGGGGSNYTAPQPPTAKPTKAPVSLTLAGFKKNSTKLTADMKLKIRKFMTDNNGYLKVSSLGFTAGKKVTTRHEAFSRYRANSVARYASSLLQSFKLPASAVKKLKAVKSQSVPRVTLTLSDD